MALTFIVRTGNMYLESKGNIISLACVSHEHRIRARMSIRLWFQPQLEPVYDNVDNVFPFSHSPYTFITPNDETSMHVRHCPHFHSPTSPHARVFPIGPITLYLITSRTMRRCSAVRGCSYMRVFMTGKTCVGVVGASARSMDVCART